MKKDRPSWDEHWMRGAIHASEMSTCPSRDVGAVIVTKDNRRITDGFNGPPSGFPHPDFCARREACVPSGEKLDMCPCTHAESNAIDNAAREGVSVRGAIMYCTTKPCLFCMGRIVNAGIVEVVYRDDYPHVLASEVAHYGKLSLRRYNVGEQ